MKLTQSLFPDSNCRKFLIPDFQIVVSVCPANNKPIAQVTTGTVDDYKSCISAAEEAWKVWADVPAPKRGEIVRQIGDALRQNLVPVRP